MGFSCSPVERINSQECLMNISFCRNLPYKAAENHVCSTHSKWCQVSGECLQVKSDTCHGTCDVTLSTSETLTSKSEISPS